MALARNQNVNSEQDKRIRFLNSLMTTPHRELHLVYPIHAEVEKEDPDFYRHFASWYADKGHVRDHLDVFITNLALSKSDRSRDVGLALLNELPPHRIYNIARFILGGEVKLVEKKTTVVRGKNKYQYTVKKEKRGLNKNIPRSFRTEVERYFAEREADPSWFDGVVLAARDKVKWLYKTLRLSHDKDGRANKILFKGEVPEDSRIKDIKDLAKSTDPAEQARIIIEKKIPYKIAASVVESMTPAVLLALITVMSDQELLKNMGSLNKRGVMSNPDLKAVVDERLAKIKKSNKVSVLTASVAADNAGLDAETSKALKDISGAQLKKSNVVINKNTALLIDKSGSMEVAIELGKRLASAIATAMNDDNKLFVYAFDSMPRKITAAGNDLGSWEKAMSELSANGGTACGLAIDALTRLDTPVDQIVIITDECVAGAPNVNVGYSNVAKKFGFNPSVRIIRCNGSFGKGDGVFEPLEKRGDVDVDRVDFDGDYFGIPNLLLFLNKSSRLDLLLEVMDYELPTRKSS